MAASTWTIYGTNTAAYEIVEFYTYELSERGWGEGGGVSGIRSTHELDVAAWHKGDAIFRLGFWKLDEWRLFRQNQVHDDTVFETRLTYDLDD